MSNSNNHSSQLEMSQEIASLKEEVAKTPDDLVAKISLASALEQAGEITEASQLYQEIMATDSEGIFAATAQKALEDLGESLETSTTVTTPTKLESTSNKPEKKSDKFWLWRKVNNLSIGQKQFIGLLTSSLISVIGVLGAGVAITIIAGRAQLRNQAIAELAVTVINYNAKTNEMATGFRGQADNIAIIEAARAYSENSEISEELKESVKQILLNEVQFRQIEYATLVGTDARIIVNANVDRTGEIFDPNNLVTEVLKLPRPIQTNAIIDWEEIEKESPFLPPELIDQDVLMKYTFTPVKDPQTQKNIGLLIAGELVNYKNLLMRNTVEAVGGGYGAIYLYNPNEQEFVLASSVLQRNNPNKPASPSEVETGIPLPDLSLLEAAERGAGGNLIDRMKIQNQWYTVAVKALPNNQGQPVAFLVRGTPETSINRLLNRSLLGQIGVGIITLLVAVIFALVLGRALTRPIQKLRESAQRFGQGERQIRAQVYSGDEVGDLAATFNDMMEQIEAYTQSIEEIARERQKEAQLQRQEKEKLQESVIRLLLDIEGASQGDLTVHANVDAGEVGSIADAFNSTLRNLQGLVKEVLTATHQVHDSAIDNRQSVVHLSQEAIKQAKAIELAQQSVEEIDQSIQAVDQSAQDAASIARQSRLAAQEGQPIMDETVHSIYKIRDSVANTSKKAKRLGESSQEISKIINIISTISEKTNILSFNASIEAARAGEQVKGFRVVADEVRRLAEQVSFAAQEIEQLISGIQTETAQMMQMMEESTTQVVTGTKLVRQTKDTLQKLADISQEIDNLLASISERTVSQRTASEKVTKTMQEVAVVAKSTSSESQSVSTALQDLVTVAMQLQESASRFKVNQ